ncbi:MAG: methionyl-tRNA formyltransferase, partial [Pseudolabrys sp.]
MRLIFMGTPDFAVPTLIELAARGHDIAAVYTR